MFCFRMHKKGHFLFTVLCIISISHSYAEKRMYLQRSGSLLGGFNPAERPHLEIHHHDVARSAGSQKGKNEDTGDEALYTVLTYKGNVSSKHPCHLHPWNPKLYDHIKEAVEEDGTKLIEFTLLFPEYEHNPLTNNTSRNYKADHWFRAYTSHGRTLLSLAFNYDILSLLMLTFGVEDKDVQLVDSPAGCFGFLSEDEKIRTVLQILSVDFKVHAGEGSDIGDDPHSCHQIITDEDGNGRFDFRCCRWREADAASGTKGEIECTENKPGKWIDLLYILIAGVKILSLLFGPLFLQWAAHSESIRKTDYVVKLKEPLMKTLLVKKVRTGGDSNPEQQREMRQFKKFRKIVKAIPSEEIIHVAFDKLQIYVDHTRLMTEQSVPVGLFHFIYENIFMCRIRNWEPFATCCQESIFGSWSPRFLWLRLKKKSECNIGCRKYLSWGHLAALFGGLLLLAAIPIPYYIRVAVYYNFEEKEVEDRLDAVDRLGLNPLYQHNLLHFLTPTHGGLIIMYIAYAFSFLLLAAFRNCNAEKFDKIAVDSIQDLRCIQRVECIKLLASHLVLPLEKFGICGFLIGAIYWPIAIPLCLLVTICYSIPSLYLMGRFLVHGRPEFLRNNPRPTSPKRHPHDKMHSLSGGTSSFESCLLLDNISPERDETLGERDVCCKCRINKHRLYTACVSWVVGLLCIVFMICVLIMFSEVFGFCVEVFVFTLMGAIVNAGSAAKYVMMAFWVLMYCATCYNHMYEAYLKLNRKIFEYVKEKLKEDIRNVTLLREERQKNTAFKYFSMAEVREHRQAEQELEIDSDEECRIGVTGACRKRHSPTCPDAKLPPLDSIEYIDDKLHWRSISMVFFVDRKDVPRIPKELFHLICNIEAPGCPGPIYQGLLKATRQFLYMILFLLFVLIVVMSFGSVYKVTTTNQMLLTLAGGFIPFVVRFVLKPKQDEVCLSTYSFEGKIHHIIRDFSQIWPVFDLSFVVLQSEAQTVDTLPPSVTSGGPGANAFSDTYDPSSMATTSDHYDGGTMSTAVVGDTLGRGENATMPKKDPTHVDLLITIRDDCDDDMPGNLREEPGSFGSRGSLNSTNRPSPEDPGSSMNVNNPTNATVRHIVRSSQDVVGLARPSAISAGTQTADVTASPSQTPPGGRPVDLMVDMVRGSVRIRNQSDSIELEDENIGATGNGMPMWSRSSPYKKVPSKEGESSV